MNFTTSDKVKMKGYRDILYDNAPSLSVYLGAAEAQTSGTATQVTVTNTVRKVMSVWLASDTDFISTNYYADPNAGNYTGKVITLDQALPTATTDLAVIYYYDCPDCGWDEISRSALDTNCATCDGTGMLLADGDAISIPVKSLKMGFISETFGATGEELSGLVGFTTKSDYENLIKAAIKIEWEGSQLVTYEEPNGTLRVHRMYNASGEFSAMRFVTERKPN